MSQSLRDRILDHVKNGQMDELDQLIGESLTKSKSDELYTLMDDLYAIGFYSEVKRIAKHLMLEFPDDDQLRVLIAEINFEDGNDMEALAMIQDINTDSLAYLSAVMVEADYYQSQGLPEVSIHKLKEAQKMYPDEEVIDFGLAEMYLATGQYEQAIPLYKSLIERGYDDFGEIDLSGRLGTSYSAIGEFELGQKNLSEASETEENADYLFQSILLSHQADNDHQVVAQSEKLIEMDPYYTSIYPIAISSYLRMNNVDQALEWANKGLEYDHLNADLFLQLGKIYIQLDQKDQAREAYKQALEIDSENEEVFLTYLDYLASEEDYDQILSLLSASKAEFQTTPRAIWHWAVAYNECEKFDHAREKFKEASLYLDDSVPFLNDYLAFLIEDGNRTKAKEIARKILDQEPDHADAQYWLENLLDEE